MYQSLSRGRRKIFLLRWRTVPKCVMLPRVISGAALPCGPISYTPFHFQIFSYRRETPISSHSLKSILEILKQPSLTKGKKQEKSSCNVRRDAPLSTNPETPKPEQQGPTAIVDRSPRYEPVSQEEKEHN